MEEWCGEELLTGTVNGQLQKDAVVLTRGLKGTAWPASTGPLFARRIWGQIDAKSSKCLLQVACLVGVKTAGRPNRDGAVFSRCLWDEGRASHATGVFRRELLSAPASGPFLWYWR